MTQIRSDSFSSYGRANHIWKWEAETMHVYLKYDLFLNQALIPFLTDREYTMHPFAELALIR